MIGNSHFGAILAKQLQQFDINNKYTYYNTSELFKDKVKFIVKLFTIDIVYSVSATISGGGALNLALRFNKKIIQHFIGSDVLSAINDYKNNHINTLLIEKSHYLCEVDWIQKELSDIHIKAKCTSIMAYENFIKPKEFDKFSVLTYAGKGREKFYGIDDFVQLASDFPYIEFKIAGIEYYDNLPSNIECLGWVNMIEELQKSTIFIRNAEHDGLGFSVIESLSLGRITLYNYDFPYLDYFNSYAQLKDIINKNKQLFDDGKLKINQEAIDFVKKNYNEKYVLTNLIKEIINE